MEPQLSNNYDCLMLLFSVIVYMLLNFWCHSIFLLEETLLTLVNINNLGQLEMQGWKRKSVQKVAWGETTWNLQLSFLRIKLGITTGLTVVQSPVQESQSIVRGNAYH